MDRMKTKFIIAVTTRLAAAEDSNAKTDLIEELSENLYQRYLDLVAAGMAEDEAYHKALEDLGDVDELWPIFGALVRTGSCPMRKARAGTTSTSYRSASAKFGPAGAGPIKRSRMCLNSAATTTTKTEKPQRHSMPLCRTSSALPSPAKRRQG